jgi:hypothetical protein
MATPPKESKAVEKDAEVEDQQEEQAAGEEQDGAKDGVVIPEHFQQATHELLKKATSKHHLNHIKDRVYAKQDELHAEEMNKKKPTKGGEVEEFNTDSVPSGIEV